MYYNPFKISLFTWCQPGTLVMKHAKISFSDLPRAGTSRECHPLYYEFGTKKRGITVPLHQHPFWQMELVLRGEIRFQVRTRNYLIKKGEFFLIPPQVDHSLQYGASENDYFSVKFEFNHQSAVDAYRLNQCPTLERIQKMIRGLIEADLDMNMAILMQKILQTLIPFIFTMVRDESIETEQDSKILANRIKSYVDSLNGRKLKVSEVAKEINASKNYVSSCFSQHHGIPLKTYIDQKRAQTAKRLLEYSDLRIKEIADAMDFPDPFTFSRFFKSHFKQSPRGLRRGLG